MLKGLVKESNLHSKLVLIIAIPFLLFSLVYLSDQLASEIVWDKYIYQSVLMLLLSVATIHVVLKDKIFAKKGLD